MYTNSHLNSLLQSSEKIKLLSSSTAFNKEQAKYNPFNQELTSNKIIDLKNVISTMNPNKKKTTTRMRNTNCFYMSVSDIESRPTREYIPMTTMPQARPSMRKVIDHTNKR